MEGISWWTSARSEIVISKGPRHHGGRPPGVRWIVG
jgi:hypothetical protein